MIAIHCGFPMIQELPQLVIWIRSYKQNRNVDSASKATSVVFLAFPLFPWLHIAVGMLL